MMGPRQGNRARAKLPFVGCRALPAINPCWNLLAGRKKELGGLVSCPSPARLTTFELQCWCDGHSERGGSMAEADSVSRSSGSMERKLLGTEGNME